MVLSVAFGIVALAGWRWMGLQPSKASGTAMGKVDTIIASAKSAGKVVMFSKTTCGYCRRGESALRSRMRECAPLAYRR